MRGSFLSLRTAFFRGSFRTSDIGHDTSLIGPEDLLATQSDVCLRRNQPNGDLFAFELFPVDLGLGKSRKGRESTWRALPARARRLRGLNLEADRH